MMRKVLKSREMTSVFAIILIFLLVGLFNPEFLASKNIFQTINGSVVYTLAAMGMAFVLFTREIDISIGATLGFSAALAGNLINQGFSIYLVFLILVAVGVMIGLINAVGVIYLKIPSIIMTLGVNGVIRGFIYVYTEGKWIENLPLHFKNLSQKDVLNTLSVFYIVTLVVAALLFFITKTKKGKAFVAVGDNLDGARLIGISINKTKGLAFIICSVFAAVAGMLYASRVGFITPTAGTGYEMIAIAACVIGGINLNGGVGTVWGAVAGALIMASISRVLVFLGFSSTYDNTITGIILIVIVVAGAIINKRSMERLRKARLSAKTD